MVATTEREGQGRFLVRLSIDGSAPIRIGYLFGERRHWSVEFIGRRDLVQCTSRLAGMQVLAQWALTQAGVRNVLRSYQ